MNMSPKNDNNYQDAEENEYRKESLGIENQESIQSRRGTRATGGYLENNVHGGSWVDDFKIPDAIDDYSNVDYQLNYSKDPYCFRLNSDVSVVSDNFEASNGTKIQNYDSIYKYYTTHPGSTAGAWIDTAYKYGGNSALMMHENIWKYPLYVNRTLNYSHPIIELDFYFRAYGWASTPTWNVGLAYLWGLWSNNNLVAMVRVYGNQGELRYYNGTSDVYTGKKISPNTWYKVNMVLYKIDQYYSRYRFTIWDANDLMTPYVSKDNINVVNSGKSVIDDFKIHIANVWDTKINCWFDNLTITATGFRSPGHVLSKPITLPENARWDSIYLNKTEPPDSHIELRILDATNDKVIYGPFTLDNEADISDKVDPKKYPSIKLNATLVSSGGTTPLLHGWGVSWNYTNTWRDSLFGGIKNSIQDLTSDCGEIWSTASTTDFYKIPSNPILKVGPGSAWDNNAVGNPVIIFNGTGYMMWYGGQDIDYKIGLAESTDGISWTKYAGNPVLDLGPASGWDGKYVRPGGVIFDGEIYHMWYRGFHGTSTDWNTGYATSTDGKNWIKHPNNPVLRTGSSTSDWDYHFTVIDEIYFDGLRYHAWYTGLAEFIPNVKAPYQMGYAISYDGVKWTKHPNNPVFAGYQGYYNGYNGHCVLIQNGRYLGWYNNKAFGGGPLNIYHATSDNGINWIEYTNNPVLDKGPSGRWDDSRVYSPKVIFKDKQYWMYYSGLGSNPQIGLAKSKFLNSGILESNEIQVPIDHYYDTMIINKTEPMGTFINVSVVDSSTMTRIKGYENLTSNIVDLSGISPIRYPSIKLHATFNSTDSETPILFDWSLNWTINVPPLLLNVSSPLIVNRTFSIPIYVNVSDKEDSKRNLTIEIEYQEPGNSEWKSEYIKSIEFDYENQLWEGIFNPPAEAKIGYYSFKFMCNDSFQLLAQFPNPYHIMVQNNDPVIWNITLDPPVSHVNRTMSIIIIFNTSDIETPINELIIDVKCRSTTDSNWFYIDSDHIKLINNHWEAQFNPLASDDIGDYIINITCEDNISSVYEIINIQVKNNLPIAKQVTILPFEPVTSKDLWVDIISPFDVETDEPELEYWYRWYKDNFYMTAFENHTTIPSSETEKNQTWRCVVYIDDGDDLSLPYENETTILNSPPELFVQFDYHEMFEDSISILENKLTTIFKDDDFDVLNFSADKNQNISVEIIQNNGTIKFIPAENWFGTEAITFYANDTFSKHASETVLVKVIPTNDLPRITQVGGQVTTLNSAELEFKVSQDQWLNLNIYVEDIDGDVERGLITYMLNKTYRVNFYFDNNEKKIVCNPHNEDVGWQYINISVTDNNETPVQFVSQNIRIHILNVNDPPAVNLILPNDGQEFLENYPIIFRCMAEDIDLLIKDSDENLTFKWSTNITGLENLSTKQFPEIRALPPGFYNLTVTVFDSNNTPASDFVHIRVIDIPDEQSIKKSSIIAGFWIWLILILIIAIVISILFVVINQKKKKLALETVPEGSVLQPDAAYLPQSGLPTISPTPKSPQLTSPQVIRSEPLTSPASQEFLPPSSTVTQVEPISAQLPPAQASTASVETDLSPVEKLKLLEQRLLTGEISEDTYLELKAKYDLEAKPYQPLPQLPPANIPSTSATSISITTPTITESIHEPQLIAPVPQPIVDEKTLIDAQGPVETTEPSMDIPADIEIPPTEITTQIQPQLQVSRPEPDSKPESLPQEIQPQQQTSQQAQPSQETQNIKKDNKQDLDD
jgi:hypothetical protein